MRRIYFLLLLLVFGMSAPAQVKFGLKAGVNIANQTNTLDVSNIYGEQVTWRGEAVKRLQASAFMNVKMKRGLMYRSEVNYSGQGFFRPRMLDFAGNVQANAATVKIDYLNLPQQLFWTPAIGSATAWIGGGGYIGFALKAQEKVGNSERSLVIGQGDNDDVKFVDAGASITTGLRFKSFLAEVNYRHGFTEATTVHNSYNRVFAISVGVIF